MKTPSVSIIVPIYNSQKYLSLCIDSILLQSFTDFELILVNDGSTDESLSICQNYAERDCRIRIINQTNNGVSSARKHGVEVSNGNYILFVDSDDTIPQDSIQHLIDKYQDNIDIVVGALTEQHIENQLFDAHSYRINCIKGKVFPGPVGKLFRKKLFDQNIFNLPKEIVRGEDMLMNVRIAFNCQGSILLISDKVYNYRHHADSCSAKFKTTWDYEGVFYNYLFSSAPSNLRAQYMPVLTNKALEVWHDFYGYKYLLPKDYKDSDLFRLIKDNIDTPGVTLSLINRLLFSQSNIAIRWLLINFKRLKHFFRL